MKLGLLPVILTGALGCSASVSQAPACPLPPPHLELKHEETLLDRKRACYDLMDHISELALDELIAHRSEGKRLLEEEEKASRHELKGWAFEFVTTEDPGKGVYLVCFTTATKSQISCARKASSLVSIDKCLSS